MRKRYQVPIKKNSTFSLNITSMTDMFTLLLVFLLQTYSTAEVQVDQENGIRLPSSNIETNLVNGVKISLTNSLLKIDNKEIASVKNNDIDPASLDKNDIQFIRPLFNELDHIAKEKSNEKYVKDGIVLFQADKTLPYSTLKKVMYTASMAGFTQIKFITIVGN